MPKTLHLLRHAKSSWTDQALDDHDRPLNQRGQAACKLLARHWRDADLKPDLILCSTATRAKETIGRILADLGLRPPVVHLDQLYLAEPDRILSILGNQTPDFDTIMVVGHNPGHEDLARRLARSGNAKLRRALADKVPTGALITLVFPEADTWPQAIKSPGAKLTGFVYPKLLETSA